MSGVARAEKENAALSWQVEGGSKCKLWAIWGVFSPAQQAAISTQQIEPDWRISLFR